MCASPPASAQGQPTGTGSSPAFCCGSDSSSDQQTFLEGKSQGTPNSRCVAFRRAKDGKVSPGVPAWETTRTNPCGHVLAQVPGAAPETRVWTLVCGLSQTPAVPSLLPIRGVDRLPFGWCAFPGVRSGAHRLDGGGCCHASHVILGNSLLVSALRTAQVPAGEESERIPGWEEQGVGCGSCSSVIGVEL